MVSHAKNTKNVDKYDLPPVSLNHGIQPSEVSPVPSFLFLCSNIFYGHSISYMCTSRPM